MERWFGIVGIKYGDWLFWNCGHYADGSKEMRGEGKGRRKLLGDVHGFRDVKCYLSH